MKKISLAILSLIFSGTMAQATTDTGNWHLVFDNEIKVDFYAGVSVLTSHVHNSEEDSHSYFGDDALLTFSGVPNVVDHANGINEDFFAYTNFSESVHDKYTVSDIVIIEQAEVDANGNRVSNRFFMDIGASGFDVNHPFFSSLEDLIGTDHIWFFESRNDFTGESIFEDVKLISISSVPVPGAVWLFGTALSGLLIRRNPKGFSF